MTTTETSKDIGFEFPNRRAMARGRRYTSFIALATSLTLVFCIVVVLTAVSIGIARADELNGATDGGVNGAVLGIAALIATFLVVMGGVTAAAARADNEPSKPIKLN